MEMPHPISVRPLPVILLTGFLGSGKTTLLNRLLRHPAMTGTAVLVNELGEVGVDQLLIQGAAQEELLLEGGCLCCTVRDSLDRTILGLIERERSGEIPKLKRLVIETTGLAEPGPILAALNALSARSAAVRLERVLTVVDAALGASTIHRHREALHQVVAADQLWLSKGDLCSPAAVARQIEDLTRLNPLAEIIHGGPNAEALERLLMPLATRAQGAERPTVFTALEAAGPSPAPTLSSKPPSAPLVLHDSSIRSHCMVIDCPLPPGLFWSWLDQIRGVCGPDLLRLKGLIALEGFRGPVEIHAVQTWLHPPRALGEWPGADRRSRLVFIARDWSAETFRRWLAPWLERRPVSRRP